MLCLPYYRWCCSTSSRCCCRIVTTTCVGRTGSIIQMIATTSRVRFYIIFTTATAHCEATYAFDRIVFRVNTSLNIRTDQDSMDHECVLQGRNNGWMFDFTLFYKLFIVSTSSINLGVIDVHSRTKKKTQICVQR